MSFSCQKVTENNKYAGFDVKFGNHSVGIRFDDRKIIHQYYSLMPYEYYRLFETIRDRLISEYMLDRDKNPVSIFDKAPHGIRMQWLEDKLSKYWCKAIHAEWKYMLGKFDPAYLEFCRALFAVSGPNKRYRTDLYDNLDKESLREILKYRAAAATFQHWPEVFIFGEGHEDEVFSWEDNCTYTLSNWRSYFCREKDSEISPELTETLNNFKPGTSFHTLLKLKYKNTPDLTKPLKSKQELIYHVESINKSHQNSFLVSDKNNILETFKLQRAMNPKNKMACRKTSDIENMVSILDRSSLSGTHNSLELALDVFGKPVRKTRRKKNGN